MINKFYISNKEFKLLEDLIDAIVPKMRFTTTLICHISGLF